MAHTDLKHWDNGQIRSFVREVYADVGADGWNMLVPRLQKALIAEKVLKIVQSQIPIITGLQLPMKEVIIELRTAMLAEAGLEDS
jgi:hypothetical protein